MATDPSELLRATPPPAAAAPEPDAAEPPKPMIHEAERASGPSGAVLKGAELSFEEAVSRRQAGEDVVVCGDDTDANRLLAGKIEAVVGPRTAPQKPHKRAGPNALPHFHQINQKPDGHCFYDTDNPHKKARKKR